MARKRKDKTTQAFDYSLAIISIMGFLGIALISFFSFPLITDNISGIILVVLAIGLLYEGRIFHIKKWLGDGFDDQDFARLVTSVVGLFILGVGILNLVGLSGPKLQAIEGMSAVIAIIVIVVQTFLVK